MSPLRSAWPWLCLSLLPGPIAPVQAADPAPAAWSDEDEADAFDDDTLFVVGNTLFTVYHELGHALIGLLGLPVIGREEDAVDGFAAVTMIPETPDDVGDALIVAVADAWSVQSDLASTGRERRYWTEHALDQQRHFAIVCLMVGSDQEGFYDYALDSGLPDERIRTCPYDFTRMKEGWQRLLAPHRARDDAGGEPPEAPITLVFDQPAPGQERMRDLARQDGLLEDAHPRLRREHQPAVAGDHPLHRLRRSQRLLVAAGPGGEDLLRAGGRVRGDPARRPWSAEQPQPGGVRMKPS
ncbi:MAG: hypothetical protein HC871_09220 [Rhizobiales bacterium]|nr:hypothetical protein [Hyphomicrobiales bacterium]